MNDKPADSSIASAPTLVVFCRRPAAGVGKRRMARSLGDAATLELARHLLATTLEDARAWPGPVIIAPADPADAPWAAELMHERARVIPQVAGNLGRRINAVDRAARADGHDRLVFIGSDAPALTEDYFARTRAALASADVVLGPAEDGGVTAMGASCAWPDLAALPWSGRHLGSELERICTDNGMTVARLDSSYDVDRVTDLDRLAADLVGDRRPARRSLCSWLHEHRAARSAAVGA